MYFNLYFFPKGKNENARHFCSVFAYLTNIYRWCTQQAHKPLQTGYLCMVHTASALNHSRQVTSVKHSTIPVLLLIYLHSRHNYYNTRLIQQTEWKELRLILSLQLHHAVSLISMYFIQKAVHFSTNIPRVPLLKKGKQYIIGDKRQFHFYWRWYPFHDATRYWHKLGILPRREIQLSFMASSSFLQL